MLTDLDPEFAAYAPRNSRRDPFGYWIRAGRQGLDSRQSHRLQSLFCVNLGKRTPADVPSTNEKNLWVEFHQRGESLSLLMTPSRARRENREFGLASRCRNSSKNTSSGVQTLHYPWERIVQSYLIKALFAEQ